MYKSHTGEFSKDTSIRESLNWSTGSDQTPPQLDIGTIQKKGALCTIKVWVSTARKWNIIIFPVNIIHEKPRILCTLCYCCLFLYMLLILFIILYAVLVWWFRLKYPHMAIGALASSTLILYFDDITAQDVYYSIVSRDF